MKGGASVVLAALLAMCAPARADVHAQQLTALGYSAAQQRDWPQAQARFEAAVSRDPGDALAWAGLGDALFWQEEFEPALRAFERANEIAQSARCWTGIGHAAIGRATREFAMPSERAALLARAGHAFARAIALEPAMGSAHRGMATLAIASRQPGGPPFALALLVALALLGLCAIALLRVARMPRAELRAHAAAMTRAVLVPYALTRAIVLIAFAWSERFLTPRPGVLPVLASSDSAILRAVAERWDANLYASVALNGYEASPAIPGHWGSLGQLPLLPIVYRFGMYAVRDAHVAALIVPHVALWIAASALYFWVRESDDEPSARRAVWVLLLLPGSLFGSALYAEPFALAGLIAAHALLQRGRDTGALLSGVLAGMARVNALAAVPMLALTALSRIRRGAYWALCAALGPLIGLASFMLYTQLQFGDALAYFHELRAHRFTGQGMFPALRDALLLIDSSLRGAPSPLGDSPAACWLGIACLLAYTWAGVDLARRRRWPEASCVLSGVALALSSNLVSMPRYLWLLFPACISFGALFESRALRWSAGALLGATLFIEAAAYAAFYFVT